MDILEFLKYSFIQRAFLSGTFIAVLTSFLGMFLVLRRMSLIGDGLSHLSFGAVAFGLLMGVTPVYIALPIVVVGSVIITKIAEKTKAYGDSAIGIVSAFGISSGVIMANLSNGFNVDIYSYLFGNILSVSATETIISILLSGIVMAVILFFYYDIFSLTFDEEYARASGVRVRLVNTVLSVLTAVSVVLAVKIVGVMLVSAMLIIPPVTSLQISQGFKIAIINSAVISVMSVIIGITSSYFFNTPAGATIVMISLVFFMISICIARIRKNN